MGRLTPVTSRISHCSCVYINAHSFSYPWFAGIARYTARLALALKALVPVRFFDEGEELLPPPGLEWSQDQDLEEWGRQIWQGRRMPLGTLPTDSIGVYTASQHRQRIFPYEISVLHDLCPIVVPWAFQEGVRDYFGKYLTDTLPASDLVLADSRSTKVDSAWFSSVDPERVVVAYPGPSLCVETHHYRGSDERSDRIGLVVATIEPRKNAAFLFDWFQKTTLLPSDMELWWVGKPGWMISPKELQRMENPEGGRRIRFLDRVSDAELCRLYQQASWSIYPSRYEGFGFPILDSLRHGTPVLASGTSSMAEFDHPGVFFFDPQDPATVDSAWQRLEAFRPVLIPQSELEERYNWDYVALTILDAHARHIRGIAADRTRSAQPKVGDISLAQTLHAPLSPAGDGSEETAGARGMPKTRLRIGIEIIGTQSGSRNRGIGRYSRNLATAMLARDPHNEYVFYCCEGLPTDQIPIASNAVTRPLRPDSARGEATLAHVMERVVETNPDGLDVLLVLNPLELAFGFEIPAKPLNGPRIAAVVYDLIPLIFQEEYFLSPEWVGRYLKGLNRLRQYDALLTLSEATRCDFLSLTGAAPERVVKIGAASDGRFFIPDRSEPIPEEVQSLFRVLGITRPFVFSVGDMDYRKNMWGLIEAFAMLPDELRRSHQLVLTFAPSGPDRDRARQYARERGVADQLVLTDWLSDKGLRVLYQRCAAFVFPSLYEGFGLPILEAMHCGSPVIVGNNSSQIEVVGDAGLLFNVADAGELAGHLARLLKEPAWAREMGEQAVVRARRFSWEATADLTLEVLARPQTPKSAARPRPGRRLAPHRRIAFFSPLHPSSSEVVEDSARLLDELKHRYKVDLYHDAGFLPHIGLGSPEFGCYDYRLFERNAGVLGYHALLYQMGNSHHHNYMYDVLLRHPGIVMLHDPGLADFHFQHAQRIVEQAAAVVVHSHWSLEQLRSRFPNRVDKMSVVAPGATALNPSPRERREIRDRIGMPQDALIIASVGRIHPSRMNVETVAAFAPLAHEIPEALLVFAGKEDDQGQARRKALEFNVHHRVRFLGPRPADLVADIAAIADIGVCLSNPPISGGALVTLMRLLSLGVPTIVSDADAFSCYPDSVVCKYGMETQGLIGLTHAMRKLATDQSARETLGRASWHYIRQNHSWPRTADALEEIIERTVAGRLCVRAGGTAALSEPRVGATSVVLQSTF